MENSKTYYNEKLALQYLVNQIKHNKEPYYLGKVQVLDEHGDVDLSFEIDNNQLLELINTRLQIVNNLYFETCQLEHTLAFE